LGQQSKNRRDYKIVKRNKWKVKMKCPLCKKKMKSKIIGSGRVRYNKCVNKKCDSKLSDKEWNYDIELFESLGKNND
jgi:transposase-like protein